MAWGRQLLDRSSRGVVLTESGRVLLERGRVILDEVRLGITEIDHLSDPTQGVVRIGTSDPAWRWWFQRLSTPYRDGIPRITYQILVAEPTTLMRGLRERKLDVLVTRWVATGDDDDMKAEILYDAPTGRYGGSSSSTTPAKTDIPGRLDERSLISFTVGSAYRQFGSKLFLAGTNLWSPQRP